MFKDYSATANRNTGLSDGTYIGPNMNRNMVRPALQQIAADGKALADEVAAIQAGPLGTPARVTDRLTYGRGETAANLSLLAGATDNFEPQILGPNQPFNILANYENRDAVTLYGEYLMPPILVSASGTFTATSFIPASPMDVSGLKVGMLVDTGHAPKFTGQITGWAANGTSVSVNQWVQMGNTADGQVPSGTNTAYFNPVTHAWGLNFNVRLLPYSHGTHASTAELGSFNERGAPNLATGENCITVCDAVDLGTYPTAYGFTQRRHMMVGFMSQDAENQAFLVKNGDTRNPAASFRTEATSGIAFQDAPGGIDHWTQTRGVMDIGRHDGTAGFAILNFHSSGAAVDFDSRLRGVGGGALGTGSLRFAGSTFDVMDGGETQGVQLSGAGAGIVTSFGTASNVPLLLHPKGAGTLQLGTSTCNLGFFGAGGAVKQSVSPAATDLSSVIALANSLRTAVVNYGMVA